MIFGNGCWLQREGCACLSPQEVYFEKIEDTKVTLCLPTSHVFNRGCTLGGVNLTMVITSPAADVLRVQTYHHMGAQKKAPEFELEQTKELPLTVEETEENMKGKRGNVKLEFWK